MALVCVGTSAAATATLTVSMVRTTMPASQWDAFSGSIGQWESTVASYGEGYDFTYSIESDADSVDFIYTFSEGWDYFFYDMWRNEVLSILNSNLSASAGYEWDIQVEGSVDPESNPLRDLEWLVDANIFDGDFLSSAGLGHFWAPGWTQEGGYYAFFFKTLSWWYVVGDGYYYTEDGFVLHVPGTDWIYRFDGDDSGWSRIGEEG